MAKKMAKQFETEHGCITVEIKDTGINLIDENLDEVFVFGDFDLDNLSSVDIDLLLWEYYDNL